MQWRERESRCLRILGDLEAEFGNDDTAEEHYRQALKIARTTSELPILIETLAALGSFLARRGNSLKEASVDLEEALKFAVRGGYRIYESLIRVRLAWLYLAESKLEQIPEEVEKKCIQAKEQAKHALKMSEEMDYRWGKVDSNQVLDNVL